MGESLELPLTLVHRHVRHTQIGAGTSEIQRHPIAQVAELRWPVMPTMSKESGAGPAAPEPLDPLVGLRIIDAGMLFAGPLSSLLSRPISAPIPVVVET
jgi:hypothetical protein